MFNTVKFMRPNPTEPYVITTPMIAVANGIVQASFMMPKVVGDTVLPRVINSKKVMELTHNHIDLIEHKPLTKEA